MNRVRSFLKLLPRFHRLFAVIGRGFPFLYKNPRNVPTNSLHSERPQWRLRHTVSDHAQQYRNKRRIVYVSRINEYRLSARHDTHWFIFSSGADRETRIRGGEKMDTFRKFSRVADTVGRLENFYFRETDHSNRSMRRGFINGLS